MEAIQVAVRLRPLNEKEQNTGEFVPWRVKGNTIEISRVEPDQTGIPSKKPQKLSFCYDHCFPESCSNENVYASVARKVILSCLEGYNGTLFMYGQTGSGKTYTMLGYQKQHGLYNSPSQQQDITLNEKSPIRSELEDGEAHMGIQNFEEKYPDFVYDSNKEHFENNTGILVQSLRDIFKAIEQDKERTYFLQCTYFEIYNDQIYDLLKPHRSLGEPLPLVEDVKNEDFVIKGITTESVGSIKQILDRLKKGELNRHYAETFMNHSSSRSHCIFRLHIKSMTNAYIKSYRQMNNDCRNVNVHLDINHCNQEGTLVTESYLNFVDLAGSERMSAHIKPNGQIDECDVFESADGFASPKLGSREVVGSRIKEGKHINKSLFFLTQVISLKADGKSSQYIPYRNSPLTKILRSSLGGNFRTAVVLCLNPSSSQIEHSLSTLRFGANAKKIQNKVRANVITNSDQETVRILVENYERRIRDLINQQEEENTKYEQYLTIIEELKLQRSGLLERLETANKKLSIRIAEEIPESSLQAFFWSVTNQQAYFDSSGLLFSSPKLEGLKQMDFDQEFIKRQQKVSHIARLKKKFLEEMQVDSHREKSHTLQTGPGLNKFVSGMSLKLYQKLKQEFDDVKTLATSQKSQIVTLCHSYKTLCSFMKNMMHLGETYLTKLHQIIDQFQDEYVLSNERGIKLELYEQFKGMSLLSDKDLSTMKEYINDFTEALESEIDRRDLLGRSGVDFPEDVINGLDNLRSSELEEQELNVKLLKEKMKDFVKFKDGCSSEIEYYRILKEDFLKQEQLEVKMQEIDKLISLDMVNLTQKIEKMDLNLRQADTDMEKKQNTILEGKLMEYKSKFEKLVDVVLGEGKKKDEGKEESIAGALERPSMALSQTKGFRRSNSITSIGEILKEPAMVKKQSVEKSMMDSKVRGWLNLKAIEEKTLNYESVLRDEIASQSNLKSPKVKGRTYQDPNGSFSDIKSIGGTGAINQLMNPMESPTLGRGFFDKERRNLKNTFDLAKSKIEDKAKVLDRSSITSAHQDRPSFEPNSIGLVPKNLTLHTEDAVFKTQNSVITSKNYQEEDKMNPFQDNLIKKQVPSDASYKQLKRSQSNHNNATNQNLFLSSIELNSKTKQYEPKTKTPYQKPTMVQSVLNPVPTTNNNISLHPNISPLDSKRRATTPCSVSAVHQKQNKSHCRRVDSKENQSSVVQNKSVHISSQAGSKPISVDKPALKNLETSAQLTTPTYMLDTSSNRLTKRLASISSQNQQAQSKASFLFGTEDMSLPKGTKGSDSNQKKSTGKINATSPAPTAPLNPAPASLLSTKNRQSTISSREAFLNPFKSPTYSQPTSKPSISNPMRLDICSIKYQRNKTEACTKLSTLPSGRTEKTTNNN